MQDLPLTTPRFRLRSLLLAGAAAFVGVLCFTSAVDGCTKDKTEPAKAAAQPDWPAGFVELEAPSGSASAAPK